MFAPAGQEEAQVQQAQELAAGDSYNYGGDGSGISNPYLGVASDETISQLQNAITAGNRSGAPGSFNRPTFTFDQYNALRGTTLADPFRDNPAGIMSLIPFDYRSQRDTLDDLERQYALFANPYGQIDMRGGTNLDTRSEDILFKDMNRLSKRPFDQGNAEEGKLRSGLQTEYGDLFGAPTGMPTVMGEIRAQDVPMSLSEMTARLATSATPLGPFVALNPNRNLTLDTSPTYDSKLDPNSPDYEGTGGSVLGFILDQVTGGAGTPALKQGTDYLKNSEAGIDLNKIISGIFSTDKGASAVNEVKDSVDQTGKNVLQDSSVSLMEPGVNLASSFNTSRTRYGDLPTTITVGDRNITNPSIALAVGIMRREPDVEFGQAMNRARMELSKRKFYADN